MFRADISSTRLRQEGRGLPPAPVAPAHSTGTNIKRS
jgi:hypothetical protein